MVGVSETNQPRATTPKRTPAKAGGQSRALDAFKGIGDVPHALVEMARESRQGAETTIEAIRDSSASSEQEVQRSLAAVRERLQAAVEPQEVHRLEAREDALLDRLDRGARERRNEIRGAHSELTKVTAGLGLLALTYGVYVIGGKDAVKVITQAASKMPTRAISP